MMRLDPSWKYIIKCKKCDKEFNTHKMDYTQFVKCCNKKIEISKEDKIKIWGYNFKCPKCNKSIYCFYKEYKCPYCGEINIKEYCFKPSTQEERDKRLREQIKSGILY
jgi:hypothetical protein